MDRAEHIADGYTILDVREPDEYQEGAIPGAIHIPAGTSRPRSRTASPTSRRR
jgi:rhodanese-related sulfurtransferase